MRVWIDVTGRRFCRASSNGTAGSASCRRPEGEDRTGPAFGMRQGAWQRASGGADCTARPVLWFRVGTVSGSVGVPRGTKQRRLAPGPWEGSAWWTALSLPLWRPRVDGGARPASRRSNTGSCGGRRRNAGPSGVGSMGRCSTKRSVGLPGSERAGEVEAVRPECALQCQAWERCSSAVAGLVCGPQASRASGPFRPATSQAVRVSPMVVCGYTPAGLVTSPAAPEMQPSDGYPMTATVVVPSRGRAAVLGRRPRRRGGRRPRRAGRLAAGRGAHDERCAPQRGVPIAEPSVCGSRSSGGCAVAAHGEIVASGRRTVAPAVTRLRRGR